MSETNSNNIAEATIPMPSINEISFKKIYERLEALILDKNTNEQVLSENILKKLSNHDALVKKGLSIDEYNKHKDELLPLIQLFFPSYLSENEIKALIPAFDFNFLYQSNRLKSILEAAGKGFEIKISELDNRSLFMMSCVIILNKYYGYDIQLNKPITLEIPNQIEKSIRYYRCTFNADFVEIIPTKNSLKINDQDYFDLLNNYDDLVFWQNKFPPKSYIFKGFLITNMVDVTVSHSLNLMTANLLKKGKNAFSEVAKNINSFLGKSNLFVALIGVDEDNFVPLGNFHKDTILLNGKTKLSKSDSICEYGKDVLFKKHKPYVIIDTEIYTTKNDNILVKQMAKKKIQSYLLAPLIHNSKFIGFLEIGSKVKKELNAITLENLKLVIPVISLAASRYIEVKKNEIESFIQREFTKIHPAVKWRFEETAIEYLNSSSEKKYTDLKNIEFPNVYALFGQADIRGSSEKRNIAIGKDLTSQLQEVRKIISELLSESPLPSYEQTIYQIDELLKEIELGIFQGSEQKVLRFLELEVYPKFEFFEENFPFLKASIANFQKKLDKDKKLIYLHRKVFDDSLKKINFELADFLDKKQKQAQEMFPHYFERFKTDGVEFNMYIGQSIAKNQKFNIVHLDNLRLWQLSTMCEMERYFYEFSEQLDEKLEIASLILLFSSPLSITFRLDEKKFDVDGSYNARYEIIKKRIDKAYIKGTNERITVPSKICIIYSNENEAHSYLKHIQFLEAKGLIVKDSLEYIDIEDLQGMTGLKAMRVAVNYPSCAIKDTSESSTVSEQKMN